MSETPTDRDNEYADIILRKNNQIKKQQEEIAHLKAKNKELEELIRRAMIPTQEAMQQSQGNHVFLRQGSKLVAGHSGVFAEETK